MHKLDSMTAQHVTSHFKLIFLECGWPDTLVSNDGPCYTAEAFTNLMQEYSVNHITSSSHYPQSNGLAKKFVQIVINLFYKAKEEGIDWHKSLMIYCNIPYQATVQSLMQMLQSRSTTSQLPMSNAARKQLGLSSEQLRIKTKNEYLPSHDFCIGQNAMFQDSITKRWFPMTNTSLCKELRSYRITTKDGVTYRKMQAHLKPHRPQHKQHEAEHFISKKSDMWTVRPQCKVNKNDNLVQSRPKRDMKPPGKLDL